MTSLPGAGTGSTRRGAGPAAPPAEVLVSAPGAANGGVAGCAFAGAEGAAGGDEAQGTKRSRGASDSDPSRDGLDTAQPALGEGLGLTLPSKRKRGDITVAISAVTTGECPAGSYAANLGGRPGEGAELVLAKKGNEEHVVDCEKGLNGSSFVVTGQFPEVDSEHAGRAHVQIKAKIQSLGGGVIKAPRYKCNGVWRLQKKTSELFHSLDDMHSRSL